MSDDDPLIAELRALDAWLDVPPAADQRAAVRARLTPRHRARWIVAGLAALVGAVGVVAPARAAVVEAVGDVLRVVGIEVRQDRTPGALPATPSPLPSARTARLDEAERAALFPVRVPAALGEPDDVQLADPDPAGAPRVVTMTFRGGTVRLDQFDGTISPMFLKATGRGAEWTDVKGEVAIWVPGPHSVTYVDRRGTERTETGRLAAPTLIWSGAGVTYRLEGLSTLAEARAAASDLR
ncbi:hypothetical protein COUCH_34475 [Couchioplanes caeruleus]|uniref:hypothetical protein n=1 Tax=Couchioplanes caeruleus TaxID=56438 RepID=UPI0020C056C7|nr:hypothetical protein [Couchioplanes caeruleus]UQU64027.1 hypothetical protein COUCH_34475 [Couchioplanes caeruleus]